MNTEEIKIINLPPERWQDFKKVRIQALKNDPQAFGESVEDALKKSDELYRQRAKSGYDGIETWLVFAEAEKNTLVGMMGAYKKTETQANIFGVYVAPEFRGKGISKKLFLNLIDRIKTNDKITTLELMVNKKQTTALKLYESYGFKITGEESIKLGDGNIHQEFIMQKSI